MNSPITDAQLAAWEQEANVATPDWEYRNQVIEVPVAGSFALWKAIGGFKTSEDGRFAASARTAVPSLIQEVRRLREAVKDEAELSALRSLLQERMEKCECKKWIPYEPCPLCRKSKAELEGK